MQADVWIDFNEVQGDEVVTLRRFARPGLVLKPGVRLRAGDDAGLECDAVVLTVEDEVIRLYVVPGSVGPVAG